MKIKILIPILLITQSALATSDQCNQMKQKIDDLENTIIQEFSIDFPSDRKNIDTKSYARLASQIEVKYGLQRMLFHKLEQEFFKLNSSLTPHLHNGKITEEEANKLKTSIEYANRIILRSRRAEINEMYTAFKESLTHTPKLSDIHSKLSHLDAKNCSFNNLTLDEQNGILSFQVQKKNKFGSYTTSNFEVTNQNIKLGQVTSKLDNLNKVNPFYNIITKFWNTATFKNSSQDFTLIQDENGNISEASFVQEFEEPLISFLGLEFGTQKIKKNFDCVSKTVRQGPTPASSNPSLQSKKY